jgi:hypothetical protein
MQEICIYSHILLLYFFQVNLETPNAIGLKKQTNGINTKIWI